MTAQSSQPPADASRPPESSGSTPERAPSRPWRTEGLPKGEAPQRRPRWYTLAAWLVGYLVLFGLLTVQDRLSGPQAIPYTEFKTQVSGRNVGELFARGNTIEGQLKKAVPRSDDAERTYQQFTTERPTFATD